MMTAKRPYRSVHKFPLPTPVTICDVRQGARVLCVTTQDNIPTIWFEVDPDAADERREFVGVPTGGLIEPEAVYVGTAHGIDGWMVFHIYERPWTKGSTDAACEWCGRAIDRDEQGRWYAVKGAERGYDPLVCDAVADRDDTDHAPTPRGSR